MSSFKYFKLDFGMFYSNNEFQMSMTKKYR